MIKRRVFTLLGSFLLLPMSAYCAEDDDLDISLRGPAGGRPDVSYAEMEGNSLRFSKVDNFTFRINVNAPNTDTTGCDCPAWFSYPITGMHFFGYATETLEKCGGFFTLNSQSCSFYLIPGDSLLKHSRFNKEIVYKDLESDFKHGKYYLQGNNISIRDSAGDVPPRTGIYPIYEIDSSYSIIDISLTQQQNCTRGTLFGKVNLFTYRGLPLRIAIDVSKLNPLVKRTK